MSSQEQKIKSDIEQKKQQIISEGREEIRNKEVNATLNEKREQLLNKENPEQTQEQETKQVSQQEGDQNEQEELQFEEIQSNIRPIIEELGGDFKKIQQACEDNKFVTIGQWGSETQQKILEAVKQSSLNKYFWILLEKCNPLMFEMFKQMETTQETDVELPGNFEEFQTILWSNLTAPVEEGEEDDEEEEQQDQDQEQQKQLNEQEKKE